MPPRTVVVRLDHGQRLDALEQAPNQGQASVAAGRVLNFV
jgi:hypothetical protein